MATTTMPRGVPTLAEIGQMRALADGWVQLTSQSGRVQQQAALPRGQREVIQLVIGWENAHLYCFSSGGRQQRQFGDALMLEADLWLQAEGEFVDDGRVRLDHLLVKPKAKILYTYDLGDSWDHRITLEAILVQPLRQARLPRCIAGRRACPPEDCGGVWGYERMLAVLADPQHPDHAEQSEWVGPGFDPETFAPESVNTAMALAFSAIGNRR